MEREQTRFNRRRVAVFAILIALVVLLILLIWWWTRPERPGAQPTSEQPQVSNTVTLPPQHVTASVPQPSGPAATPGELIIMNLARNFAERYGSWSTDSSFQNLNDLRPVVTSRLEREFDRTIAASSPAQTYQGVNTRALRVDIIELRTTTAEATVTTQRIETDANLVEAVRYEKLNLLFVKDGEFWYVDQATWEEV